MGELPGWERPEIHDTSAYNRKPKGKMHQLGYEARLAIVRKNLSTQDDKFLKLRKDY